MNENFLEIPSDYFASSLKISLLPPSSALRGGVD
jgi:hypothetical protein